MHATSPSDVDKIPIVHVGLGSLGQQLILDLLSRRNYTLIGVVDTNPELAGTKLSELIAGAPSLTIRSDVSEVTRINEARCAVVTTTSQLSTCAPLLRQLLSAGCSVVTTCEEMVYPYLRHPKIAEALHECAAANGARLLGTGVNPGFLMDAVPVFASSVAQRIDTIEVQRIQDATPRRTPFQVKIGSGMSVERFNDKLRDGTMGHVGLLESLHLLTTRLRLAVDDWTERFEPVIAEAPTPWALGTIPTGSVRGIQQIAVASKDNKPVVTLLFRAAIGEIDPHDTVFITGVPNIELTWRGGVHGDVATCAIVANTIPSLLAAPPGLHLMTTIASPAFVP